MTKFILPLSFVLAFLVGCAHGSKTNCDDHYAEDPNHGRGGVEKIAYKDSAIYAYKDYYFSQIPPDQLAEFAKAHDVKIVIDLRMKGSEKELTGEYPAVYWGHPMDDLATLDEKKISEIEEHLETFEGRKILFVSDDGDSAITAFVKYWAEAHALNDDWVAKVSGELGLKNLQWLKKWDAIQEKIDKKEHIRSSASE